MKREPVKDSSEAKGENLNCGCIADRRLLYCSLCLKCMNHCPCTDQERADALARRVTMVTDNYRQRPSFFLLKERWRGIVTNKDRRSF